LTAEKIFIKKQLPKSIQDRGAIGEKKGSLSIVGDKK
jgi:hypothetical protein